MTAREPRTLLRIYLGELDKVDGTPLYEAIVRRAHESGLAGVTVWRGVESFGAPHRLHTAKVLVLGQELPVIVDIIETPERAEAFLEVVDDLISRAGSGGLVTLHPVEAIAYPSNAGD